MKRLIIFAVVAVVFIATPAMATYVVDLGTPAGEAVPGVTLSEWGRTWPILYPPGTGSPQGGWGGFGSGTDNKFPAAPPTYDYQCRSVWGPNPDTTNYADIIFSLPITSVDIRHLDGSGNDSFKVEVDGVLWGSYTAPGPGKPSTGEYWNFTTFSGPQGTTLRITVTAAPWGSIATWGQLGIDRVEAEPIPEPATICMLGIGALALLRKRRA